MRIAMVSEHASPLAVLGGEDAGGQNVHVAALATELGRRGIDVVVYTRWDDPELPERVELAPGVAVRHVAAGPPEPVPKDRLLPFMDEFAVTLRRAWAGWRPDLVHSHFWMSGRAALAGARPLSLPVVHTFHALGVVKRRHQGRKDTSPPGRLAEEERIAREVDRILATSSDEVFELARLGADLGRVRIVPCGVDTELFRPDGHREPRDAGRHRIVVVSRLVERKGVGDVVLALARLRGTDLVVVGGPERERLDAEPEAVRLAALAREAGVADRVDLRGRVERTDLPALLRSADAVVCVPWYEPFGLVPLEAMACGVPVVASAVGGQIDSVVDGSTGVHVPPRNPERLAEELEALLADPARRAALGRAGARRARGRFTWERIADAALEAYGGVLAEGVPGGSPRLNGSRRRRRDRPAPSLVRDHVAALGGPLTALEAEGERLEAWGRRLAAVLLAGGRLLAVGNGGSAAHAQHLTCELVGRFEAERRPFSAIALTAESSALTAIVNDYGADEAFARQVRAHGRSGDVLLALSTSGASANVLAAVRTANECGLTTWALTGPAPNPLAAAAHDRLTVDAASTPTVQEVHQIAVHLLCRAVEQAVERLNRGAALTPLADVAG